MIDQTRKSIKKMCKLAAIISENSDTIFTDLIKTVITSLEKGINNMSTFNQQTIYTE